MAYILKITEKWHSTDADNSRILSLIFIKKDMVIEGFFYIEWLHGTMPSTNSTQDGSQKTLHL